MAHDGSLASKVEDWIVGRVAGLLFGQPIDGPAFAEGDVRVWEGTDADSVQLFTDQLFQGNRNRVARVLFVGDRPRELEDVQVKLTGLYNIIIGLRDYRPGEARRGSGVSVNKWGTNWMRGALVQLFNQQRPNLDDGIMHTDKSHYEGATIQFHPSNVCIMKVEITVDEVPKAN